MAVFTRTRSIDAWKIVQVIIIVDYILYISNINNKVYIYVLIPPSLPTYLVNFWVAN